MVEAAKEFRGTERFSLRRKLGAGGMGVVYEAIDRLTNKPVALKTLNRAEPEHIYRLKREFRELADVSHPNLAALYELMSSGRHWFFTMNSYKGPSSLSTSGVKAKAKQAKGLQRFDELASA